jgi:hypothetical protein
VSKSSKQTIVLLASFVAVLATIVVISSRSNHDIGLRVQVLSARRTEPGATEKFTVSIRDTKGKVTRVRVDFDDGRVEDVPLTGESCGTPLVREYTLEHAFEFTGYSTVSATVETSGCGADPERVEAIRTVEVRKVRR